MQKTKKTLGLMLEISPVKLKIANGYIPHNMTLQKINKIKQQVSKRLEQIAISRKYQPFTSGSPKRKPRQVGA